MRIRHDNSGRSPGWYLDKVEVRQGTRSHVFPCRQWLAKSEGDGLLSRELTPIGATLNLQMKSYTSVSALTMCFSRMCFSLSIFFLFALRGLSDAFVCVPGRFIAFRLSNKLFWLHGPYKYYKFDPTFGLLG